jgi:hypothetical protein
MSSRVGRQSTFGMGKIGDKPKTVFQTRTLVNFCAALVSTDNPDIHSCFSLKVFVLELSRTNISKRLSIETTYNFKRLCLLF